MKKKMNTVFKGKIKLVKYIETSQTDQDFDHRLGQHVKLIATDGHLVRIMGSGCIEEVFWAN